MAFPILDLNQNYSYQKQIRDHFGISENVYMYPSTAMALQDLMNGYLQYVPHKKSIAVVKGQSDLLVWVLPQLYRQNYHVQILQWNHLSEYQNWLDQLKPDTSCLMIAHENPLSGQELDLAEEIKNKAQQKKIPTISISYCLKSFFTKESTSPMAEVYNLPSGRSLILTNSRFRFYSTGHLTIPWQSSEIQSLIAEIQSEIEINQNYNELVKNERLSQIPRGFQVLDFHPTRKINLLHPEITGDLLLRELEKLKPTVMPLTTHFCYHEAWSSFSDWWQNCPEPSILRHLICCQYSFYRVESNWKKLEEAAQVAIQQQSW